jgi:hypothetical protein
VFPQSAADNLRAARGLGRCAALAANDAGLSRERRAELADDYGRHSVDFLRRATERGYRNLNFLKTDSALAPVRSRDDFQKLLQELEIPR